MILKITPFAHDFILKHINPNSICVDMTMGNGNDTLFLAKEGCKVYAFDIQQKALDATTLTLQHNNINNVQLILDSHENVDKYINEPVDIVVYNLGYLPGGNKHITTQANSTIDSIQKVLSLLKDDGIISITVYPGHDEGKIESDKLLLELSLLSSSAYNVLIYQMLNKNNSPYNIFIENRR